MIEREKEPERTRPRTFWLIVQDDGERLKVFELGAGRGGKSLPIFSFEEVEAAPSFEPGVSAMSSISR